jgi:D-alanine-D-alanine ligase
VTKKLRIGVVFGGQSGEHEVSLVSAQAVLENLDRERYEVVPIGITKQGRWLAGGDPMAALKAQADPQLLPGGSANVPAASDSEMAMLAVTQHSEFWLLTPEFSLDVIFPVLHGPMGEDGTIQGLFELAGVAYIGCGVLAAAVGMDKAMMKSAFAAAGLPLLPWLLVRRVELEQDIETVADRIEQFLHYPVFVKPANMGSSVGISKAKDRAGLLAGLRDAARYDRRIVVEQGINAREIEVSVLGNETVVASVAGEVVPSNEWYDYEAKYLAGKSQILIPAPIATELAEQVRTLAALAFAAVDGAGLARIDFLLDKDTDGLYINEVNTMPGFTPVSMYAQMWAASGLAYPQLLDRLVELAIERNQQRQIQVQ